ncbi:MAG: hypothetical protein R2708_26085 [Vicinamibacterales bacterium]
MTGARRSCLLVVLVTASATVRLAHAQTPVPAAVPPPVATHVRAERFQEVTAVRGLPLGVREALQRVFGSTAMAMADPGAPFQATDEVTDPALPARRLVLAACSTDHCVVYYERGGVAHTWRALLFHWTPDVTTVVAGGVAPRGLQTFDDVRQALLTGGIRAAGRDW